MRKRHKSIDIKVGFDRRHVATKSTAKNRHSAPIYIEVYYDRRRVYFTTGIKVFADQFKNGRIYNHGQQGIYNERIKLLVGTVEDYVNEVLKKGTTFNMDMLKEYMGDVSVGNDNSFLDFMEKSIDERGVAESTKDKHRNVFLRLKEWGHIRSFKDVTVDNVAAWHNEAVKAATKAAFTVNYDRVLRIYVRLAYSKGLVKENPYARWKVPKYTPAQTHRSITIDDLSKISKVELDKKFEVMARDLFVFQANTGLAYVDTQNFNVDELLRNKGRLAYQNSRVKTAEPFYIPLNDTAKAILYKYGGKPPMLGLEAYNVNIKRVAKKAGVNAPVSSHWARHTFAMVCLNNGMSYEVLAAILGHSDIRTTMIYAHLNQEAVDKAFDDVMDKIKGGRPK